MPASPPFLQRALQGIWILLLLSEGLGGAPCPAAATASHDCGLLHSLPHGAGPGSVPTHSCRVLLIAASSSKAPDAGAAAASGGGRAGGADTAVAPADSSFSLNQLVVECWAGDEAPASFSSAAAVGGANASKAVSAGHSPPAPVGADAQPPVLRVRLGRTLAALVNASLGGGASTHSSSSGVDSTDGAGSSGTGLVVRLSGVAWDVADARPGLSALLATDGSTSDPDAASSEAGSANQGAEDWGLDLLPLDTPAPPPDAGDSGGDTSSGGGGVPHLRLVDSAVVGVPLSSVAPLLQCLGCARRLSVSNLTLVALEPPLGGGISSSSSGDGGAAVVDAGSPPGIDSGTPPSGGIGGDGSTSAVVGYYGAARFAGAGGVQGLQSALLEGVSCSGVRGAQGWACLLLQVAASASTSTSNNGSSSGDNSRSNGSSNSSSNSSSSSAGVLIRGSSFADSRVVPSPGDSSSSSSAGSSSGSGHGSAAGITDALLSCNVEDPAPRHGFGAVVVAFVALQQQGEGAAQGGAAQEVVVEGSSFTGNNGGCGAGLAVIDAAGVRLLFINTTAARNVAAGDGGGLLLRGLISAEVEAAAQAAAAAMATASDLQPIVHQDAAAALAADAANAAAAAAAAHGVGLVLACGSELAGNAAATSGGGAAVSGMLLSGVELGGGSAARHNVAGDAGGAIHVRAYYAITGSVAISGPDSSSGGAAAAQEAGDGGDGDGCGGAQLCGNAAGGAGGALRVEAWAGGVQEVVLGGGALAVRNNSAGSAGGALSVLVYGSLQRVAIGGNSNNGSSNSSGIGSSSSTATSSASEATGAAEAVTLLESNTVLDGDGGAVHVAVLGTGGAAGLLRELVVGGGAALQGNVANNGGSGGNGGAIAVVLEDGTVGAVSLGEGAVLAGNRAAGGNGGFLYVSAAAGVKSVSVSGGAMIVGNRAEAGAGGSDSGIDAGGDGGGVYVSSSAGDVGLFSVDGGARLEGNTAAGQSSGGEASGSGGAIFAAAGGGGVVAGFRLCGSGTAVLGNSASLSGGGVHLMQRSNAAAGGGRIIAPLQVLLCDFAVAANNTASPSAASTGAAGPSAANGGFMYAFANDHNVSISITHGAAVAGNRADTSGGGLHVTGGSIAAVVACDGSLTNNTAGEDSGGGAYLSARQELALLALRNGAEVAGNVAGGGGAGGGVYAFVSGTGGVTKLEVDGGSRLEGNRAGGSGGGFFVQAASGSIRSVRITNGSSLAGNAAVGGDGAGDGGALYLRSDGGDITQLSFDGAASLHDNAAVAGAGIAAVVAGGAVSVDVSGGSRWTRNTASGGDGGALQVVTRRDADLAAAAVSRVRIGGGAVVSDNSASGNGGAIAVSGYAELHMGGGAALTGNTAGGDGGLAAADSLPPLVTVEGGAVLAGNRALRGSGGALSFTAASATRVGGAAGSRCGACALYQPAAGRRLSDLRLTNCSVANNTARVDGGAIRASPGESCCDAAVTLRLAGVQLAGNHADGPGGAIAVANPAGAPGAAVSVLVELDRCRLTGNSAGVADGVYTGSGAGAGGAIFMWYQPGTAGALAGPAAAVNTSSGGSGSYEPDRAAACLLRAVDSVFDSNKCEGGHGGALALMACAVELDGCSMSSNAAALSGGAVAALQSGRSSAVARLAAAGGGPLTATAIGVDSGLTGASADGIATAVAAAPLGHHHRRRRLSQGDVSASSGTDEDTLGDEPVEPPLVSPPPPLFPPPSVPAVISNSSSSGAGGTSPLPSWSAAVDPSCVVSRWRALVRNCTFQGNTAQLEFGGALYAEAATAGQILLYGSTLDANKASIHGAAAFIATQGRCSGAAAIDLTASANTASFGSAGGVYVLMGQAGARATLRRVNLTGNTAGTGGGGGAVVDVRVGGVAWVEGLVATGNKAGGGLGGGLQLLGAGSSSSSSSSSSSGGGGAELQLWGSRLEGNTAAEGGGGLAASAGCGAVLVVRDSALTANRAGGAAGSGAVGDGGALHLTYRDANGAAGGAAASGAGGGGGGGAAAAAAGTVRRLTAMSCADGAAASVYGLQLRGNSAAGRGAGAYVTPGSAAVVQRLVVSANAASLAGGGLAAVNCTYLAISDVAVEGNSGGGVYVDGCARLLLQSANVSGNAAGVASGSNAAGGGLFIGGGQGTGSTSVGISGGAAADVLGFSTAVLHRVLVWNNTARSIASGSSSDSSSSSSSSSSGSAAAASLGAGGAVFAAGQVAVALSQCDLARGNAAVLGSSLATTQTCAAASRPPAAAGVRALLAPNATAASAHPGVLQPWALAWAWLDLAAQQDCWALVLSDTILPRSGSISSGAASSDNTTAGNAVDGSSTGVAQQQPLWLSDQTAAVLQPRCSSDAGALVGLSGEEAAANARTTPGSAVGGIRTAVQRLLQAANASAFATAASPPPPFPPVPPPPAPGLGSGDPTGGSSNTSSNTSSSSSSSGSSSGSSSWLASRYSSLMSSLAGCWDGPALSPVERQQAAAALAISGGYLGLPPTRLGLLPNVGLAAAELERLGFSSGGSSNGVSGSGSSSGAQPQAWGSLTLRLHPGEPFDVAVRLYDRFGQPVSSDASASTVTLELVPQPPGGGAFSAAAAAAVAAAGLNGSSSDSSRPWLNASIAFLDPGVNKSLIAPVAAGVASWRRVTASGWPGAYLLTFTLTSPGGRGSGVLGQEEQQQVPPLAVATQLLPCVQGQTLDLSLAEKEAAPAWTSCAACGTNQYGLWEDVRPTITADVYDIPQYLRAMRDAAREARDGPAACLTCPAGGVCPGGAAVVPEEGRWHSAPNSTQIHDCPNRAACGGTSSGSGSSSSSNFWGSTSLLLSTGSSSSSGSSDSVAAGMPVSGLGARTLHLIRCQQAWYNSWPAGSSVRRAYFLSSANAASTTGVTGTSAEGSAAPTALPASAPAPSGTAVPAAVSEACLLWGLPASHPDGYMQQLCAPGYTGNLCAACVSGFYIDTDFNCNPCPPLGQTLGLGLLAFAGSVILVLFTAVANFAEGFAEDAEEEAMNASVKLGAELKISEEEDEEEEEVEEDVDGKQDRQQDAGAADFQRPPPNFGMRIPSPAGLVAAGAGAPGMRRRLPGSASAAGHNGTGGAWGGSTGPGPVGEGSEDGEGGAAAQMEVPPPPAEGFPVGPPHSPLLRVHTRKQQQQLLPPPHLHLPPLPASPPSPSSAASTPPRRSAQLRRQQLLLRAGTSSVRRRPKRYHADLGDVVKVIVLHLQYFVIVTRLDVDYPHIIPRVQAVFGAITGAEVFLVYSPSCLRPQQGSAGQARLQLLAGLATPCAVLLAALGLWVTRYLIKHPPTKDDIRAWTKARLAALRRACSRSFPPFQRSGGPGEQHVYDDADLQRVSPGGGGGGLLSYPSGGSSFYYGLPLQLQQISRPRSGSRAAGAAAAAPRPLAPTDQLLPIPLQPSHRAALGRGGSLGLRSAFRDVQVVNLDLESAEDSPRPTGASGTEAASAFGPAGTATTAATAAAADASAVAAAAGRLLSVRVGSGRGAPPALGSGVAHAQRTSGQLQPRPSATRQQLRQQRSGSIRAAGLSNTAAKGRGSADGRSSDGSRTGAPAAAPAAPAVAPIDELSPFTHGGAQARAALLAESCPDTPHAVRLASGLAANFLDFCSSSSLETGDTGGRPSARSTAAAMAAEAPNEQAAAALGAVAAPGAGSAAGATGGSQRGDAAAAEAVAGGGCALVRGWDVELVTADSPGEEDAAGVSAGAGQGVGTGGVLAGALRRVSRPLWRRTRQRQLRLQQQQQQQQALQEAGAVDALEWEDEGAAAAAAAGAGGPECVDGALVTCPPSRAQLSKQPQVTQVPQKRWQPHQRDAQQGLLAAGDVVDHGPFAAAAAVTGTYSRTASGISAVEPVGAAATTTDTAQLSDEADDGGHLGVGVGGAAASQPAPAALLEVALLVGPGEEDHSGLDEAAVGAQGAPPRLWSQVGSPQWQSLSAAPSPQRPSLPQSLASRPSVTITTPQPVAQRTSVELIGSSHSAKPLRGILKAGRDSGTIGSCSVAAAPPRHRPGLLPNASSATAADNLQLGLASARGRSDTQPPAPTLGLAPSLPSAASLSGVGATAHSATAPPGLPLRTVVSHTLRTQPSRLSRTPQLLQPASSSRLPPKPSQPRPHRASASALLGARGSTGTDGGGAGSGGGGSGALLPLQHSISASRNRLHGSRSSRASLSEALSTLNKLRSRAFSVIEPRLTGRATLKRVDQQLTLVAQLGIVFFAAVFILYPAWAHTALSVFACYEIDDGTGPFPEAQQAAGSYWVRDMQQACYSGTHLSLYVPLGVAAVAVFCAGPPAAAFFFVWRIRHRLEEEHIQRMFGFLYKRYKPRFIWWESMLMLETLALVAVEVLGRSLIVSYQALLLLAVFIMIAAVNISCSPLRARILVMMEFMSLATLSLTITLSLYFSVEQGLQPSAQTAVAVLIILLNVGLLAFFTAVVMRKAWGGVEAWAAPRMRAAGGWVAARCWTPAANGGGGGGGGRGGGGGGGGGCAPCWRPAPLDAGAQQHQQTQLHLYPGGAPPPPPAPLPPLGLWARLLPGSSGGRRRGSVTAAAGDDAGAAGAAGRVGNARVSDEGKFGGRASDGRTPGDTGDGKDSCGSCESAAARRGSGNAASDAGAGAARAASAADAVEAMVVFCGGGGSCGGGMPGSGADDALVVSLYGMAVAGRAAAEAPASVAAAAPATAAANTPAAAMAVPRAVASAAADGNSRSRNAPSPSPASARVTETGDVNLTCMDTTEPAAAAAAVSVATSSYTSLGPSRDAAMAVSARSARAASRPAAPPPPLAAGVALGSDEEEDDDDGAGHSPGDNDVDARGRPQLHESGEEDNADPALPLLPLYAAVQILNGRHTRSGSGRSHVVSRSLSGCSLSSQVSSLSAVSEGALDDGAAGGNGGEDNDVAPAASSAPAAAHGVGGFKGAGNSSGSRARGGASAAGGMGVGKAHATTAPAAHESAPAQSAAAAYAADADAAAHGRTRAAELVWHQNLAAALESGGGVTADDALTASTVLSEQDVGQAVEEAEGRNGRQISNAY